MSGIAGLYISNKFNLYTIFTNSVIRVLVFKKILNLKFQ